MNRNIKKRMIDLIDRKKLLYELRLYPTDMSDDDYDFIERLINSQQTIIPIQHAHWIVKYGMGEPVGAICSNCESEIGYDRNGYFSETDELYCHKCGCKMDEKTE